MRIVVVIAYSLQIASYRGRVLVLKTRPEHAQTLGKSRERTARPTLYLKYWSAAKILGNSHRDTFKLFSPTSAQLDSPGKLPPMLSSSTSPGTRYPWWLKPTYRRSY